MDVDQKELSYETGLKVNSDLNLKYVQSEELELTWKAEKRERMKQREQRIWEQFVQEKDIVGVLCKDDPYQFIEDLPESYILELLEKEFQNIKDEKIEVDIQTQENYSDDQNDVSSSAGDSDVDNVYFMYHTGDESGPEEELNESIDTVPCTVREVHNEPDVVRPTPASGDKVTSKSSENMIENSVYCSKIIELQMNIKKEAVKIISFLETAIINIEPEDVGKLTKRSTEFGVRFNRVHVYQLQRQLRDIQRHADAACAGGGARHTLARALCVRLVSLLQNILHAVQAVDKLLQAGGWCDAAGGLLAVLRDSAAPHLHAAAGVNVANDENMAAICEQLDAAFSAHAARVAEYLTNLTTLRSSSYASKTSRPNKKKFIGTWTKNNTRAVDQRLSMYSLDAPRPRRTVTARTSLSGMSKSRINADVNCKDTPKKTVANLRVRRRAPADPQTLVEAVELNSLSQLATPRLSARSENVPPLNITTPKTKNTIKKKASATSVKNENDKEQEEKRQASTKDIDHGDKVADEIKSVIKEVPEICSGDASNRNDCCEGPKNVQLVCVKSTSPLISTPRKEKLITEKKQIKSPKEVPSNTPDNEDKYRMTLDVPEQVIESLLRYRSKFMQYMLNSALYANSSLGKPLEMISSVSEKMIDDLLLNCVNEMELKEFTEELYKSEMN